MNLAAQRLTSIAPFAYWPERASGVAGLGGADRGDGPSYAFHSAYAAAKPGRISYAGRFRKLSATRGVLRIAVRRLAYGSSRTSKVAEIALPLAQLAEAGGEWRISLVAEPNSFFAIVGQLEGESDAAAESLEIDLTEADDSKVHIRSMLAARRTVFARKSRVGRHWWNNDSPLDRAGLISREPATLSDPVSQMCTTAQFEEPIFDRWLGEIGADKLWHRKQWEFIYILAVLERHGMIRPGSRGLGFGCGKEFLPSVLAARGCTLVATDIPAEDRASKGWISSGQHAEALAQLHWPALCPADVFQARVTFRPVDMVRIPPDLRDFDFCWSACAYEHLGSIEAGLRFVRESVRCLRPGGVAVHTSELNLSSDDATVDHGNTVLFRRRDMERLALELLAEGHKVAPLKYDQGDRPPDLYVDAPPYGAPDHLRIALLNFVTTSFGFIVVRGGG